jgi:hypothetical protein
LTTTFLGFDVPDLVVHHVASAKRPPTVRRASTKPTKTAETLA